MDRNDLMFRLEAALFAAGDAVSVSECAKNLCLSYGEVQDALIALKDEYDAGKRGLTLALCGDTAQLATRSEYSDTVLALLRPIQRMPLSQAVLETLAVVAYKQPVTRLEIDQIRGVKSDSSVSTLLTRGLIREVGRRETLGRPMEFGTTDLFLRHFGYSSLLDLPETQVLTERGDAGDNAKEWTDAV